MNRRFGVGILIVIVLALGALGIGVLAFNMGLAQGIAQSAQAGDGAPFNYAPYLFFPRPWGFGFGLFGFILFLLFLFLIFGLVRRLIWGGPLGWRYMRGGPANWGEGERQVPPFFEEWHRRAHA